MTEIYIFSSRVNGVSHYIHVGILTLRKLEMVDILVEILHETLVSRHLMANRAYVFRLLHLLRDNEESLKKRCLCVNSNKQHAP